jgi:soluble lytic murein transglycosylase-like protein
MLRLCVVLLSLMACAPPASAAILDGSQSDYASLLRTINPHLQIHQSLAYARSILADAQRNNIDPRLLMAVVTVESRWRPNAVSPVGARGLGQLMPTTASILGVNPWDPSQNLRGAAGYLRTLINRFADRGVNTLRYALGAYNAGPQAVEHYKGIPPYRETQNYVKRVLAVFHRLTNRIGITPPPPADAKQWLAEPDASALPLSAS